MTSLSVLSGLAALAFVLAVVTLGAALARRWVPGARQREGAGRIEVLARASLAPRQGLATVQVAGRSALVSYGEGGVRLLMELDGAAEEARSAGSAGEGAGREGAVRGAPAATLERGRSFGGALARAVRRSAGMRVVPVVWALAASLAASSVTAAPALAQGAGLTQDAAQGVGRPAAQPLQGTTASSAALLLTQALPDVRLSVGSGADRDLELSGPVGTVLFVGFLTVLPTLLLLMTSFTRILVVLHLLKQALGTQTAPPAHLLTAMALILTMFVMTPTLEDANERALAPWVAGEMDTAAMLVEASVPFRAFMLEQTRGQDLAHFVEMSGKPAPATPEELPLMTLVAAFVSSELTSAFQMGFALFLPFVVIDLVVASVLMSMGMFMLPPVMVSLPFKLLLFVLVDGWSLVVGSLVQSFA